MRYLILTDIHANLEALDTCLADASARGYERTLVLGDIVGYGPDPTPSLNSTRSGPWRSCAAITTRSLAGSNSPKVQRRSQERAFWTQAELTPDHRDWLAALRRARSHRFRDRNLSRIAVR
jgi:hypothetical protein